MMSASVNRLAENVRVVPTCQRCHTRHKYVSRESWRDWNNDPSTPPINAVSNSRVPKITLLRMGLNIGIYFVGGLIPLAGDLFDAWWKPNIRNINLVRKRATVSAEEARQGRTSDWVFVAIIIGTLLTLLFGSVALSILFFWYVATHLSFTM